jgi:hypothetical protein
MKVQARQMHDRGFDSAPPAGSLFTCFLILEVAMLFALFLIVTSSTGMTTTHVGNYKDRAACEAAAKSVTIVIRDNATIGFVTMCIAAVDR